MTLSHCGTDFGTSNSTVAVAGGNAAPRLLPLEEDRVTIPSAIFFSFEEEAVHVGRRAISEYVSGAEGRLMRSLKSVLGTALFADATRVKQRAMSFAEILGLFIGELKRRAEAAADTAFDRVVCGRPVHFVDDDAEADARAQDQLEAAVRAQGFRHVEFQFEPIAAALDYERGVAREELAIVADIGGGTSDFTVIRLSPERAARVERQADILSTGGVHLGGTDFDRLLSLVRIMPLMGYGSPTRDGKRNVPAAPYYDLATWHRINRLYNQKSLLDLRSTLREAAHPDLVGKFLALVEERQGHRLAGAVEAAKIALSEAARIDFAFSALDVDLATSITAPQLHDAVADATAAIARAAAAAIELAGVGRDAVATLILTGGSTRLPAVATALRELLPAARAVETDAFGSVGLGLAIDAERRFG